MVGNMVKFIFCTIMLMLLVSCSSLKSEHYVGEIVQYADEEVKETTLWEFDDKIFFVNVIDSSTLAASTIEWNEETKKHEIVSMKVLLTELKDADAYFLNLKEDNENLYTILLLAPTKSEKNFIIYTVDDETIRDHIKNEKVKAIEDGDDYILKLTKEELDKYISENFDTLFSRGEGGVIRALSCKKIIQ